MLLLVLHVNVGNVRQHEVRDNGFLTPRTDVKFLTSATFTYRTVQAVWYGTYRMVHMVRYISYHTILEGEGFNYGYGRARDNERERG